MSNEKILKDIEELIMTNRVVRQSVSATELEKDAFRKNNDVLARVRTIIKNFDNEKSEDYEKGLNDAWELAERICGTEHPEMFDCVEVAIIFDTESSYEVFDKYTYQQAIEKIEEYEKQKAEEAAKPVRGDIVRYKSKHDPDFIGTGIYIYEDSFDHTVWNMDVGYVLLKHIYEWTFEKTGKRLNNNDFKLPDIIGDK